MTMRPHPLSTLLLVALLAAPGCARILVTTSLSPGTDLSEMASYAWAPDGKVETGDVIVDEHGLGPSIRSAIAGELSEKNYTRVAAAEADFHIRYHAAVEHRVDEMDLNADQTDRAGWWGPREDQGYVVEPGVTGQYVREWDEGSLVIDFVDPQTARRLYRMKADTRLHLYTVDEEERRQRVRKVVRRMLASVPAR